MSLFNLHIFSVLEYLEFQIIQFMSTLRNILTFEIIHTHTPIRIHTHTHTHTHKAILLYSLHGDDYTEFRIIYILYWTILNNLFLQMFLLKIFPLGLEIGVYALNM